MANARIELKRHHRELSDQETEEVVCAVADLIVSFLRGSQGHHQSPEENKDERERMGQGKEVGRAARER